jgi:two-component system, NarL family, sensor kinase
VYVYRMSINNQKTFKMKKSLCLLFLLLSAYAIQAQSVMRIDSLLKLLPKTLQDTNTVNLYINIGQQYQINQPKLARYYYQKAGQLSRKLHYPLGSCRFAANYSAVLSMEGKYDSALIVDLEGLHVAEKWNNKLWIYKAYFNIGGCYNYKLQYEKALSYYLKVEKYFEEIDNKPYMGLIYDVLQVLYRKLNEFSKAVSYGEKAVSLLSGKPTSNEYADALINLSNSYMKVTPTQTEKAMKNLKKAMQIARKNKNFYLEEIAYIQFGDIYYQRCEMEKAKFFYTQALSLNKKTNYKKGICFEKQGLAYCELSHNHLLKAEKLAREVLTLATAKTFMKETERAFSTLAELELVKHNYIGYRTFLRQKDSVSNIIMNDQIIRTIKDKETIYETSKQQIQIELLKKDKKIQFMYILGLIVIALFIIIIGSIFRHNQNRKRQLVEKDAELKSQRIGELEKEKILAATQAILVGEENERKRLSRDLHDGLGGMLSVVKFNFSNIKGDLALKEKDVHVFDNAIEMLDDSIRELRRVAHNLMPESLIRYGLQAALTDFCGSIDIVKLHFFGEEKLLTEQFKVASFRIVQELVNNAIKHAVATEINVQVIIEPDRMNIVVHDNGKGFDPSSIDYSQKNGLNNIQMRIESLNGIISLLSQPGKGTEIEINFTINS